MIFYTSSGVQSTNQPINQSTNQPINQSTNQPINQSTNQPISQWRYLSTLAHHEMCLSSH
uniref:PT domain-containing protein n=1 Tax=Yersinia pestis TaxID=632 RepID=UPI000ACF95C0